MPITRSTLPTLRNWPWNGPICRDFASPATAERPRRVPIWQGKPDPRGGRGGENSRRGDGTTTRRHLVARPQVLGGGGPQASHAGRLMGERGPKPKPTELKLALGNPGKRKLPTDQPKPNKSKRVPTAPKELGKVGKAAWRRLVKVLEPLALLPLPPSGCGNQERRSLENAAIRKRPGALPLGPGRTRDHSRRRARRTRLADRPGGLTSGSPNSLPTGAFAHS